jgi:hypothetical protein
MDPPTEKLIADALAHGLWIYSWLLAVLGALGAGIGAYIKKAAEIRALNENFQTSLDQLREQTKETESIKTELAAQLDALSDIRERERSFSEFQRTDIASNVTALINCTKQIIPA